MSIGRKRQIYPLIITKSSCSTGLKLGSKCTNLRPLQFVEKNVNFQKTLLCSLIFHFIFRITPIHGIVVHFFHQTLIFLNFRLFIKFVVLNQS